MKKKTRAKIGLSVIFEDVPLVKRDFSNIEDTMASLKEIKRKLGGRK